MSRVRTAHRTTQDGFTLIELLVVVLVIGILASIAIPAFLGQKRKAQDQATKSILRSGVIAAESYYTEHPDQTFNGMVPALLADHEQNVVWVASNADAIDNEIEVALFGTAPNENAYALASQSQTGTYFVYLRTPSGASFRCSGTAPPASAAVSPLGCGGTFSGGW
jgi:prepilin-type N-terminal cleavage/methylation domain-containing protein